MLTKEQARIVCGMSAAAYHADPSASASKLKAMHGRTPAHCLHRMRNPMESEAMALGSLLHSMVLEPTTMGERYVVMPGCDRRTKVGKELWAGAIAAAEGKTVVKAEDLNLANAMVDACEFHPAFHKLFRSPGENELSIFWHDDEFDIDCKLRADRVVNVPGFGRVCVDLKTTRDASPKAFAASVYRLGYHIQGAMYLDGLAKAGLPCDAFVTFCPESEPPHCVAVYAIKKGTMEKGWEDYRRLLKRYTTCAKADNWPGYSGKIEKLEMPAWAFDEEYDDDNSTL